MLEKFIKLLAQSGNSPKAYIVDPEPANKPAIRCYEKAGFTQVGEFQTPCGPALVMIKNRI